LVGGWDAGITSMQHGFVCSEGRCSSFDVPVPGATLTKVNAINMRGQFVGTYLDANGGFHAFSPSVQNMPASVSPVAKFTSAWGINSSGHIVGRYKTADGQLHGFKAEFGN